MRLPELKKHFKNKSVIRIVAGVLVVAMVGTGASVYGLNSRTADENLAISAEGTIFNRKNATEKNEEKLTDALNSSLKINEVNIGKEETVYVMTDSTGKATKTIVSDHLINQDKKEVLEDASTLSDIENVKGNEAFTQSGNKVSWQAGGKDIFYQGTSDQEAPITEKITYYLDGKEITPEDLAGKSGKVTIRFDYTNNTKVAADILGKKEEVCVPFVALTGMVLDDSFTDIEVSNGRVIADGNSNIVVGYALPGLKDSLKVDDSDFDSDISIPDYFEVSAQVEDFSLEMTMTAAVNATNFISAEGEDTSDSVDELLDKLTDATDQLKDGSGELAEGMDTLQSKMGEFSNGVISLQDAITAYTDGATTLNNGIGSLKDGVGSLQSGINTLADNVPALVSGVGQLKAGTDSAAEGAKNLAAGAAQVSEGVNQAVTMIQGMGATLEAGKQGVYDNFASTSGMSYDDAKGKLTALQGVQESLEQIIDADVQLVNGFAAGVVDQATYLATKEVINQKYAAVAEGLTASGVPCSISNVSDAVRVVDALGDVMATIQNGIGQVDGAVTAMSQVQASLSDEKTAAQLKQLVDGASQVAEGAANLSTGVNTIQAGMTQLNDKAGTLSSGASQLKNGAAQLASGAAQLADGAGTLVSNNDALKSGAAQITDATGQLADGVGSLQDGAHQLADGIVEFNESGIEKIVNSYNGDLKPLLERMQAVLDAGSDYQTFTDIADDMNGSVKFIYKTAAIKAE